MMLKGFARARLFAAVAVLVSAMACGADAPTAAALDQAGASGAIQLRLSNAGGIKLTSVSVLVAEQAPLITASELQPGQTTTYVARREAHENPLVTLKIDGQELVSHPVEGFSGFNPALAEGKYTISLEQVVVEGYKALYVRVLKD